MRTLVCQYCGKRVLWNKAQTSTSQQYCGAKACQPARKLSFEREKYNTNSSFRSNKLQEALERNQVQADYGDP